MTLNWSDILGTSASGDSVSNLPPVGNYDTRVKEAKVSLAGTGKTMIEMVLVIDGGPYDDEWLWDNLVFPDATSKPGHQRMFRRDLHALGFSNDYLITNNPTAEALAAMMVGRSVTAKVTHKLFDGETRTEVKSLHPIGSADDTPPTPSFGSDSDKLPPPPVVTPEEPKLLEEVPPIPVVEEPPVPVASDDSENETDTDTDEAPF